jgi:hypothetical protein
MLGRWQHNPVESLEQLSYECQHTVESQLQIEANSQTGLVNGAMGRLSIVFAVTERQFVSQV